MAHLIPVTSVECLMIDRKRRVEYGCIRFDSNSYVARVSILTHSPVVHH